MKRLLFSVLAIYLVLAGLRWAQPPEDAVDLGPWHLVVIESDDWGLEAWFPNVAAAEALADLVPSNPSWMKVYGRSSLETAAEIDSLRTLLLSHQDSDGLPPVLQANHIVAAIDLAGCGSEAQSFDGLPYGLRQPGVCGPYLRPGRDEAIDRARREGVWRPELHGLVHFDLVSLKTTIGRSMQRRAASHSTLAYPGWLTRSELGGTDAGRENTLIDEAVRRFTRRFGRGPASVIAPDYRWNSIDEGAWRRNGIQVVQSKPNQRDRFHAWVGVAGRARRKLGEWRDRRRARFVYLERNAHLEPYGKMDFDCRQGARKVLEEIHQTWSRGEVAVVEAHRLQFSNFDAEVSAAGRWQLGHVLGRLENEGVVRYCVDVEVAQLKRRGWSVLQRGPWIIVRNYTADALVLDLPSTRGRPLSPGTHVFPQRRSEDRVSPQGYR